MQECLSGAPASGWQTLGSASSEMQTDVEVRDFEGNVAGKGLAEREIGRLLYVQARNGQIFFGDGRKIGHS